MSTNFDIKSFLINEGMTRVSRDRKRLLKESVPAGWTEDEWEEYRSRKEAEKIFKQGGAGDRRGTINRSAMGNQQGRRRGLKGSTQAPTWLVSENVTDQDYEAYREWQKENGWDDKTIDAAIEIWKQHPDMFAIELENPIVDDLEAFVAEPELYLSGDPEDLATAVKQNIYKRNLREGKISRKDRKRLLKEAEENNETTWIEVRDFKIVNSSDPFDEPEDEGVYNQALKEEGVEDGRYIVIDADSDDVPDTEPDYIITTESGPWTSIEYLYRYRTGEPSDDTMMNIAKFADPDFVKKMVK